MSLEILEFNPKLPAQAAVIWLHGLGASGDDFRTMPNDLDLRGLAPIRFIFPHAPVMAVTIFGGQHARAWYNVFGDELQAGPKLKPREDETTLRKSQAAVGALIQREIERGIPSENIILAGFSQGCAVTLLTGLRYPQRLAGLVCLSGYLPLADTTETERSSANADTPIFMGHGTQDPIIPMRRGMASRDQLTELGYRIDWHEYLMPHSVYPEEVEDISAFFQRVMPKAG